MLSSLSGGGIAYKLELEIIRSPSTSWASQSSSPSSTLSENSNSPVAISTRKPRTPRKRPNQTYNEAAALLSTAYPKIFSATVRNPPGKFTRPNQSFSGSSSDLLLPFSALDGGCDGFLLQSPVERILNRHPAAPRKLLAGCGSPREIDSNSRLRFEDCDEFEEDFESESILDEEIEEGGIDSIMGKLNESNDSAREAEWMSACYGFPIGMGFKAIKQADNGDWWRFPVASINVADITPKTEKSPAPATEKKKKKKKVEKPAEFRVNDKECSSSSAQSASKEESSNPKAKSAGLLLKLNYDSVLSEWTDRPSPFSDESPCSDAAGTDVQTRLAQIDLFLESGVREASVLRYKEKRRTRLFSKKIRYQVRKVNADRRPRMKGRFVKSPNSPDDSEQG